MVVAGPPAVTVATGMHAAECQSRREINGDPAERWQRKLAPQARAGSRTDTCHVPTFAGFCKREGEGGRRAERAVNRAQGISLT